jgi:hypothetical protein
MCCLAAAIQGLMRIADDAWRSRPASKKRTPILCSFALSRAVASTPRHRNPAARAASWCPDVNSIHGSPTRVGPPPGGASETVRLLRGGGGAGCVRADRGCAHGAKDQSQVHVLARDSGSRASDQVRWLEVEMRPTAVHVQMDGRRPRRAAWRQPTPRERAGDFVHVPSGRHEMGPPHDP